MPSATLVLTSEQRAELERRERSRRGRADAARRARVNMSDEFVAFVQSVVETQPRGRAIHVIVDNLSAHKTQKVRRLLAAHSTVRLHSTPTYSSWLNQVELRFSKIERDVIARGIFISVADLRRKLMRYIRHYNHTAKPFRWAYASGE